MTLNQDELDELAALFQQHTRNGQASLDAVFLAPAASDRRIAYAEKLAEDALACQALKLANRLKPWSTAIGRRLAHTSPLSHPWWKPIRWLGLGLACAVLAMVVMTPQWQKGMQPADQDTFFAGHFERTQPANEHIFTESFAPAIKDEPLFKAHFDRAGPDYQS